MPFARLAGADLPLGDRAFRRVFAAEALSLLGDAVARVAIVFAVLGVSNAAGVGFVLAARQVTLVGLLLGGGVLADRIPPRALIVGSAVARTATQATSGLLLVTGSAHLWELVALQAAYGAAEALSLPAQTGLVADVVAPERLQAANSLRAFARSVADVAGPALAGVLVVGFGAGWGLVVDAASFAAGAALLATVRAGTGVARTAASRLLADLRHGWRAFRGSAWLWRGVALMALWNGLYGMFAVLGPVVAARDHGGAAAWAAIGTAVGVGSVAGGLVLVRVRPRRPGVLMSGGLLCSCGPPIALATGVPLAGVIAAAVLSGAASVGFNATWESTVQREIPRDVLSRVAAYDMVGSFALGPVGTATGGLLAAPLGASALLLTMGVARLGLAAAFWAIPGIRALRGPS